MERSLFRQRGSPVCRKMLSGRRGCYTGGVKQFVRRAGRGGDVTRVPCAKRWGQTREGFLRALPFSLGLASCGDPGPCAAAPSRLIGRNRSREPPASGLEPLESPPELPPARPGEPILTLPGALTAYVLLLAVIHLRVLLPPELENWTIDAFGFIPKRYDPTLLAITFPGGTGAKVWTFVTYSLLHANLSHLGFNVLWLLPFGSALARRFGAIRFFAFMAVTAAAAAPRPLLPPP